MTISSSKMLHVAGASAGALTLALTWANAASADTGPAATVQELIVTANKREQNLQLTPLSVTALGAADMEGRQVESAADLQRLVPGMVVAEEVGVTPNVTIRGVGAANSLPGGDPGVPVHLDGHYLQASRFITRDFLDVERVEVLRGPQGTLYGRNASGGSINIIGKRPTREFEGLLSAGLGNYNARSILGVVSGPITDRLSGRLAATHSTHDGYVENISPLAPRKDLIRDDYVTVRGALELEITPRVTAYLSAYAHNNTGDSFAYRLVGDLHAIGGPTFASLPVDYVNPTNADPFKVRQDSPNTAYDRASGLAFDLDWRGELLTLKSLTAYNRSASGYRIDLDATDATPKVTYGTDVEYDTYSQEFQAIYDGERIKSLSGLFAYRETSVFSRDFQAPPGIYGVDYAYSYDPAPTLDGKSFGVFQNLDIGLTDRLSLTAGGRYSYDKKSMRRGYRVDIDGAPITSILTNMSSDWTKLTGRAALSFQASEDINLYASASTGYKSGGFNAISVNEISYRPETVTAFELGLKTQWFADRLRINLAAFTNEFSDKQEFVLQLGAGAAAETAIRNAASARMRGVEVEYLAILTPALRIDGAASYLKAEYKSFSSIDTTRPALGEIDLSGNRLPYAPEWKFNIGLQYDMALEIGGLVARVDYAWRSSYFSDAFNRSGRPIDAGASDRSPSGAIANASLIWTLPQGDWSVLAYVRNIADEQTQTYVQKSYHFALATNYEAPRTFGLKVTRKF